MLFKILPLFQKRLELSYSPRASAFQPKKPSFKAVVIMSSNRIGVESAKDTISRLVSLIQVITYHIQTKYVHLEINTNLNMRI